MTGPVDLIAELIDALFINGVRLVGVAIVLFLVVSGARALYYLRRQSMAERPKQYAKSSRKRRSRW